MTLTARSFDARIAWFVTFAALASVGAKWFVVVNLGGRTIELSNLGALLVLGACAIWIAVRGVVRSYGILNLLLVLLVLIFAAFAVHGDPAGILVMSLVNTTAAYALAMVATVHARTAIALAFFTLLAFIGISAMVSGVDVVGGFLDYLQTLNRDRFNARVVRPVYNAFAVGGQDDGYTTTLNNALAATFCLFYAISGSHAVCGDRLMGLVAFLSLGAVFLIFSSSGVLVASVISMIFLLVLLRHTRSMWTLYAIIVGITVLLGVTLFGATDYLLQNVMSDTDTRQGRLLQYAEALQSIDAHFWLGDGFVEANGHYIHNFPLFAFAATGVVGGTMALAVFAMAVLISLNGLRWALGGARLEPTMLMMATLPLIFMIRSLVGGAGGLPNGPGILALAFALVAMREFREGSRREVRPPRPAASAPIAVGSQPA